MRNFLPARSPRRARGPARPRLRTGSPRFDGGAQGSGGRVRALGRHTRPPAHRAHGLHQRGLRFSLSPVLRPGRGGPGALALLPALRTPRPPRRHRCFVPTLSMATPAGESTSRPSRAAPDRCGQWWWSTPTTRPVPSSTPTTAGGLVALCRERDWALIADEVFLPYPLDGGPGEGSTFAAEEDCLCCTLGGLSKSLGLPQLKLAWIVVNGPEELVEPALDGLDYVADAYLAVSTPVALALPQLLADGAPIREAIGNRCRSNLASLRSLVSEHPAVSLGPVGGGLERRCCACRRCSARRSSACNCSRNVGLPSTPGTSSVSRGKGWLVISLLPSADQFAEGVRHLLDGVAQTLRRPIPVQTVGEQHHDRAQDQQQHGSHQQGKLLELEHDEQAAVDRRSEHRHRAR